MHQAEFDRLEEQLAEATQVAEVTKDRDEWRRKAHLITDDPDYQQCCTVRNMWEQRCRDRDALLLELRAQVAGLTRGLKIAIGELACSGMSFDHPTITLLGRILEGKPMFPRTSCSQCGQEFGPGDHGFSHCQDHTALAQVEP